ncbi:MAG: hypothetical protein AABY42_09080 [Nitrospirota bacterium]
MILNLFTIIMLFMAVLTAAISLPICCLSYMAYRKGRNPLSDHERTEIEDRSYLLMLVAVVVLFLKLLNWPFFYVTLQSYIPNIQGAMCIFGVTQAQPLMSGLAQIMKPVVFFSIGGWLFLNRLDRMTETSPLFARKFLLLGVVSIIILIDSVLDIAFFTGFDIKTFVSCCTTYFDLPERPASAIPVSLFGSGYERYLLPLYYASNAVFILSQAIAYRMTRPLKRDKGITAPLTAGAVIAVLNAIIGVIVMFEVIAPKVMSIPLHHCIYCMWQYEPHSIIMTALFIIGTFSPGWALTLYLTGRHDETMLFLERHLRLLSVTAIACTGASVAIATLYMIL